MRSLTSLVMAGPRASLLCLASVASVAACAGSSDKAEAKSAEDPVASPAGSPKPEPRRAKLAPAPASLSLGQFWPTRICTRGPGMIIVASSCVCDSRMTCSVTRRGGVLDLRVAMTQEICKDCGTFMATCTVPAEARPRGGSTRTFRLTIDGKPVLDALELPRSDAPPTERCYE
jgi:hypothetical protein